MTHERVPHTSHWGAFEAEVSDGTVVAIHPYRNDPDPSRLLGNIVDSLRHSARVTQPMIRAGWLDRGPGADARRGAEPFEPVSWPTAIGLLAGELRRVYDECGDAGVYENDLREAGAKLTIALGTGAGSASLSDSLGDNSVTARNGRSLNG
jgi:biotin/methionine sulfoxide reductase